MNYTLKEFKINNELNVFLPPIKQDMFNYSDGNIEDKIYQIVRNSKDNSIFSRELKDQIVDWATEYHFSPLRHNLLRHIEFKNTDTILELGCGCGAITRQLGESGALVTAVEGSVNRAKVAASRCKDLPNVDVYSSNFQNIIFENQFDYVTLIGVLEYSTIFVSNENPFKATLNLVKRALKPDGKLIIAIENRLGLKYFMGQSEDHGNPPFFGIQDLYNKKTAKTLGRKELQVLLEDCNFRNIEFQYPFPDYKIPEVVFFESAFSANEFSPSDIISQLPSRDYTGNKPPLFSEKKVWPIIEANGLVQEFSNSFLIIASLNLAEDKKNQNMLCVKYTVNRKKEYNTITEFVKQSDDNIIVRKKNITYSDQEDCNFILELGDSVYYRGENLDIQILKAIEADNFDQFIFYTKLWLDFIISNGIKKCNNENIYNSTLLPYYIDCLPKNLMITDNGLKYIDQEWALKNDFVFFSLILKHFAGIKKKFINKYIRGNRNPIHKLLSYLEIPIDNSLLYKQESFEEMFSKILSDYPKYNISFYHKNNGRRVILKIINLFPKNTIIQVPYIIKRLVKSILRLIT